MLDSLILIDEALFLKINGLRSSVFDTVFYYISKTWFWIPLYTFLLIATYRKLKLSSFLLMLAFVALLIFIADSGSVHLFKNEFQRLRPCHDPDLKEFVLLVNNKCGGKYGFISSHAANTAAVASFFALVLRLSGWFSALLFIYPLLTGYSRIYLGVHYPFDVMGGFIYGVLTGIWTFLLFHFARIRLSTFISERLIRKSQHMQ